ncbi:MAG: hypothetical protein DRN71_03455 [Candidatus Nanohalarchaeota archaeon]|nr:MAG: hypothetical protein DRN71_03455 [Candidatus Nanohaloarchaeota archaeon]
MAEINPKKINIKTDIPTGKIITPNPKPIPLEMPPPPKPGNISQIMQKIDSKSASQAGLPPMPNDLRPKLAQAFPNTASAPPKQAFSSSPVAHPPIPPQPTSSPSANHVITPPAESLHAQGIPSQPETVTIEMPKEPIHDPLQKEIKRRISQVKGPVFISLERYRDVKELLYSLKENSRDLRGIMDEFKGNKKESTELLTQSVDKLEHIEEDIENINATLRT